MALAWPLSSAYARAFETPRRSGIVSAIVSYGLSRCRELRLNCFRLSRCADHFFTCLELRHFGVPQYQAVNSHVSSAKAINGSLKSADRGVSDSRTQNHVWRRDNAAGATLNVARWSGNDDEVVTALHASELFPHFLHNVGLRRAGAPGTTWQHVERAVTTDCRRND